MVGDLRRGLGRDAQTTFLIVDAQSVKNTDTLAVCSMSKFVGFNHRTFDDEQRKAFVEDTFQLHGVVHDLTDALLITCEAHLISAPMDSKGIGHILLTKTDATFDKKKEGTILQNIELEVTLYDESRVLQESIQSAMRDAALSGYSFIHIDLKCPETSLDELQAIISKMTKDGHTPTRFVEQIKMNPSIELKNSPQWARQVRYA